MKLRPSEDIWIKLDMMLQSEDNSEINFNRIIIVFSFFILMSVAAMIFIH